MSQNMPSKAPNKIINPPQQEMDDPRHHKTDDGAGDTPGYPAGIAPHGG
jgi:hypothetical protein